MKGKKDLKFNVKSNCEKYIMVLHKCNFDWSKVCIKSLFVHLNGGVKCALCEPAYSLYMYTLHILTSQESQGSFQSNLKWELFS